MKDLNEIKEFIISNYPRWKIFALFKHGVNVLIDDENYMNIDQKISDYEIYFDYEIENRIIRTIKGNIILKFECIYPEIESFIFSHIEECIPSFKKKTNQREKNLKLKWFNNN
jgi:hypothetical protein